MPPFQIHELHPKALDFYNALRALMVPRSAASVVKSDVTVFDAETRQLYIGTGGDLTVTMAGSGDEQTYVNVPDGFLFDIAVTQVKDATTASDIVAHF